MAKRFKKDKKKSKIIIIFALITSCLVLVLYTLLLAISYLLIQHGHLVIDQPFNSLPLICFVIIGFIIGIIISSMIMKILYRPINKMSQNFKKISKGEFNIKIEDETLFDEINELYKNFNIMTKELSSIETLRNDFVVNVSHEFKTPLATIEGYATLLQDVNLDSERRNIYTEKIIESTRSLSTLTKNILTLSKLENQDLVSDKKMFLLDEQIKQTIIDLESYWSNKNIEFDLDLDETYYSTNEGLSRQIWYNLINNAIKYSNDFGKISISIKKDDNSIIVIISDNGIGMSKETLQHIFDKFYQADTSHKSEGNGLGLALVKRIITLLKGSIDVESQVNVGSTFKISLPLD